MDLNKLRDTAKIMEEFDLTHLSVEEDGFTLNLERRPQEVAYMPALPVQAEQPAGAVLPCPVQQDAPAPMAAATSEAPAATPDRTTTEVTAPMVGVFYAAPAPGAEPFVHVDSTVHKGETLCILEAMKLMNEIVAERDGKIAEICVADGELVEYGRVLFKIY